MKEINQIRSEIGTLRKKLADAQFRLEQAGLRHLGLSVGDVIEVKTRRGWLDVSVTGCNAKFGEPNPLGVKMKKDGTVGSQSAGYISTWRKKEADT